MITPKQEEILKELEEERQKIIDKSGCGELTYHEVIHDSKITLYDIITKIKRKSENT